MEGHAPGARARPAGARSRPGRRGARVASPNGSRACQPTVHRPKVKRSSGAGVERHGLSRGLLGDATYRRGPRRQRSRHVQRTLLQRRDRQALCCASQQTLWCRSQVVPARQHAATAAVRPATPPRRRPAMQNKTLARRRRRSGALPGPRGVRRRRRRRHRGPPAAPRASDASGEGGTVGVILPDASTSPRWEANDRPLLAGCLRGRRRRGRHPERRRRHVQVRHHLRRHDQRGRGRPAHRQPGLRLRLGLPEEGAGRRHRDHRLRPPHPRRRRVLLRLLRQRRGRPPHGRGPGEVPHRRRQDRPATSSTSTATRPTTTPRCSSRATSRRSSRKVDAGKYKVVGDQTGEWDADRRRHRVRAALHARTTARSTASSPPTTRWPAASSPASRPTASTARSRSPVRTPASRACRRSSPATSA